MIISNRRHTVGLGTGSVSPSPVTQAQKNKWSADAEATMMWGVVIPVQSKEHLEFMVHYVIKTLKGEDSANALTPDCMEGWDKYNSTNTPVSHFSVNSTQFGVLLTLVRDGEMKSLTDEDGVLAYVYNMDAPDCSELGYVFFENKNGKIHRVG
jgi:hypothetical protein